MADDHELYELAKRFPEAVLTLLGVQTQARYRGEALEVKAASGRFDAVLTPEEPVPCLLLVPVDRAASPRAPRIFVEFQNRRDADAELRWALKVIMLVAQTPRAERGPVRLFAVYGEESFLEAARGGADLGDGDERLLSFVPRRLLLRDIDPARLEAAGWAGRLVLPLVGDEADVERNAGRWARELTEASLASEERERALDLFVRFLYGRLGEASMKSLLEREGPSLRDTLKDTATGRALIAEGEVVGLRRAVLDLLEARGVAVPDEVLARLEEIQDSVRLRQVHRAALTVSPDLRGLFEG